MTGQSDGPAREQRYLLATGAPKETAGTLTIVDAQGSWVTLADGRRMLDLHGQHMCLAVGHRHPTLVAALHRAVDGLGYAADFASHTAKVDAATMLIEQTMEGAEPAGGVRFVSSGSEATEMAMLLARLYTERPVIVTRDLAFHGWTGAAAAATGVASLRSRFTSADGRVRGVPSPHAPYPAAPSPLCSNCPLGQSYPTCKDDQGTLACVRATERVIRSVGVEQVAAFITEIWHGAGAFLVPPEYPSQIRAMTTRLGILWIDDEAIGGPARTGRWWGFQHYGVQPDLVTMAKGVGNASVPAGACVVSSEIADVIDSGWWGHSSTFSGHPLATAAIVATLSIIVEEDLVTRAARLGRRIERRLRTLADTHPCVGGVTGQGLLWGIELVRDPTTGRRWVAEDRWHTDGTDDRPDLWPGWYVVRECARRGVLQFNYAPNTVTIAPPLTVTEDELDLGLSAIDEALTALDKRLD